MRYRIKQTDGSITSYVTKYNLEHYENEWAIFGETKENAHLFESYSEALEVIRLCLPTSAAKRCVVELVMD